MKIGIKKDPNSKKPPGLLVLMAWQLKEEEGRWTLIGAQALIIGVLSLVSLILWGCFYAHWIFGLVIACIIVVILGGVIAYHGEDISKLHDELKDDWIEAHEKDEE